MHENWETDVAEQIRQQADSGARQEERLIVGPVVFNKPVRINGNLTITND